jgi:hypothetical protein
MLGSKLHGLAAMGYALNHVRLCPNYNGNGQFFHNRIPAIVLPL